MYEFYPSECMTWICIAWEYAQIVRTDQQFLIRCRRRDQSRQLHQPHATSLLPPSPLRTRPKPATTCRRPTPLKAIEIDDDDDKVEVVEPPTKRANVVKINDDDDEVEIVAAPPSAQKTSRSRITTIELVEPSSRRRSLSASPIRLSVNTSDSTASIRSLELEQLYCLHIE
ncbi:hypothetical protein K438DRAFT_1937032 [Mycena galopus ATCC 62051]|nr:hypothetical protein K438DRAFT_1937032 [Mycena galopus ATCC 62051]